jgi:S1-C subfamily serine protease
MESLLTLSNDLAAAVQRAGRTLFAVHGRPRLGSTGIHWRSGLVVTAHHTVQTDRDLTVTCPDGRSVAAEVAGRDPGLDLAILRVDAPDVPVADIEDATTVRVGHIVLALGAGPRASWGIVSAIGDGGGGPQTDGETLTLDLSLYPGFSGGPLVDVQGRVIGVNTSGASRRLRLAIRAAAVTRVVDELLRRGRIPRAYLGVGTHAVRLPQAIRDRLNVDQDTAVVVVDVQPDSPAAAAGMSIGDVIVALDGTRITAPEDLRAALRPDRVGQTTRASILRGGEPRGLEIVVGERPRRP